MFEFLVGVILSLFNHLFHHFPYSSRLCVPLSLSRVVLQKLIKKQKKSTARSDYSNEVRLVVLNCDFWFLMTRTGKAKKGKIIQKAVFSSKFPSKIKISNFFLCLCWFRWKIHFIFNSRFTQILTEKIWHDG